MRQRAALDFVAATAERADGRRWRSGRRRLPSGGYTRRRARLPCQLASQAAAERQAYASDGRRRGMRAARRRPERDRLGRRRGRVGRGCRHERNPAKGDQIRPPSSIGMHAPAAPSSGRRAAPGAELAEGGSWSRAERQRRRPSWRSGGSQARRRLCTRVVYGCAASARCT
uniref:Uncharacterized protein n=1 Tax=Arundo donax TaxID=35708 RepID=A0A0A8YFP2_ARUDO